MTRLPPFPQAVDDGGGDHLTPGMRLPAIALPATDGGTIALAAIEGRCLVIVYPWTGRSGLPNPPDWDSIPGAHGSTPELEGFRDRFADFAALGLRLFGLSRQATVYQRELAVSASERRRRRVRRGALPPGLRHRRDNLPQAPHASHRGRSHRAGLLSRDRSGRSRRRSFAHA